MRVKTLVENTSISKKLGSEHGLSLFIETDKHKILFDVGAGPLFLHNAKKLDIDIAEVDFLIISHGHYDHGGGLQTFLDENRSAEVFLHRQAFGEHYAVRANEALDYIGLDEDLQQSKQIIPTSDRFFIENKIQLFSNINKKEPQPKSNKGLVVIRDGQTKDDSFDHEQNLVISEDGKTLLVVGCAHNGIINILEHFYSIKGRMPDYVIGGFHLSSRSGASEDKKTIDKIGKYLNETKSKYFTCHCTGAKAYGQLKAIMGDNIGYLATGSALTI